MSEATQEGGLVKAPEVRKRERVSWWPPRLGGTPLMETRSLVACAADPSIADHMALLSRWFSDTELGKWMEGTDDNGEEGEGSGSSSAEHLKQSFSEDYCNAAVLHGDLYFVFFDRTTTQPVGFGAIYEWRPALARAEISFMIGEAAFRGRGLGKEVVGALCEFAFMQMHALSLVSSVVLENVPSKRAMEHCGFATIGVRHRAHSWAGLLHDETLMECLPESYIAVRDSATHISN